MTLWCLMDSAINNSTRSRLRRRSQRGSLFAVETVADCRQHDSKHGAQQERPGVSERYQSLPELTDGGKSVVDAQHDGMRKNDEHATGRTGPKDGDGIPTAGAHRTA